MPLGGAVRRGGYISIVTIVPVLQMARGEPGDRRLLGKSSARTPSWRRVCVPQGSACQGQGSPLRQLWGGGAGSQTDRREETGISRVGASLGSGT